MASLHAIIRNVVDIRLKQAEEMFGIDVKRITPQLDKLSVKALFQFRDLLHALIDFPDLKK